MIIVLVGLIWLLGTLVCTYMLLKLGYIWGLKNSNVLDVWFWLNKTTFLKL